MKPHVIAALSVFCLLIFVGSAAAKEQRRTASGMNYYLLKPGGFNPTKPTPLLILLHGVGDNPDAFMGWCNFRWAGSYLRVYPFQTQPPSFQLGDEDKMADIIKELKKEFKISKVIVFGFSNGAQYAFVLALKYPLLVSAAIPHSGALMNPAVPTDEDTKRVAFAIIHGSADQTVPVGGSREANEAFTKAGYKWVKYWEIPGLAHHVNAEAVEQAHNWLLEVFKKGGGGGEAPWSSEEAEEKMGKVKSLAGEKKFKEAEEVLNSFNKKGRFLTDKTEKIVADALKPLSESADRETKLFAIRSLGYAGAAGVAALKKILADAEKGDEEIYLAAVSGHAGAGEKALSALHSIMTKDLFKYKGVIAAVEAIQAIKSKKSLKPLVALLADVEKAGGEKAAALAEPVKKALTAITGVSCADAEKWKQWLKENDEK